MALPATSDLVQALGDAYSGVTAFVAELSDDDLLAPSGCHGWNRADLLLHLTGDAQRALVALATPSRAPADTDFVSYWRTQSGSCDREAEAAHARWIRRSAAAFDKPSGIVRLWCATGPAAVRATAATGSAADRRRAASFSVGAEARIGTEAACTGHEPPASDAETRVLTQGLVLAFPDFLATLITEAVLHHLDLIEASSAAPGPADSAVRVALATVGGLLGDTRPPASWDGRETLLKCTGRMPLTESDQTILGPSAGILPVIGANTCGN
jgi:hypothetical protein